MAHNTAATTLAIHEKEREAFSGSIMPVDEKRFESEIRRIDAAISDENKNHEKFETKVEKSNNDLRGDMKDLRGEIKDLRGDMKDLHGEIKDLRGEMRGEMKDLRGEIKDLRDEMNTRIGHLDDRLWWLFGAIVLSILLPLAMKYL
jgi:peptidoglycan hydrolase CwlO-like protein